MIGCSGAGSAPTGFPFPNPGPAVDTLIAPRAECPSPQDLVRHQRQCRQRLHRQAATCPKDPVCRQRFAAWAPRGWACRPTGAGFQVSGSWATVQSWACRASPRTRPKPLKLGFCEVSPSGLPRGGRHQRLAPLAKISLAILPPRRASRMIRKSTASWKRIIPL